MSFQEVNSGIPAFGLKPEDLLGVLLSRIETYMKSHLDSSTWYYEAAQGSSEELVKRAAQQIRAQGWNVEVSYVLVDYNQSAWQFKISRPLDVALATPRFSLKPADVHRNIREKCVELNGLIERYLSSHLGTTKWCFEIPAKYTNEVIAMSVASLRQAGYTASSRYEPGYNGGNYLDISC